MEISDNLKNGKEIFRVILIKMALKMA